jgi:site-specific recombinase XerD
MAAINLCLTRSTDLCGDLLVRLGVPVLDDYLRFVAARARPNTVLATAYDLAVFFRVVSKPPVEVTSADVLGFITAQRTGSDGRQLCVVADGGGLSARTVRRRLSSVSGLFGYLQSGTSGVADSAGTSASAARGAAGAHATDLAADPGTAGG